MSPNDLVSSCNSCLQTTWVPHIQTSGTTASSQNCGVTIVSRATRKAKLICASREKSAKFSPVMGGDWKKDDLN